ncbi:hypothetical protein NY547_03160 [Cnuibacter physcomitrellae]|uniref:hypothetical protein n=1 Tax=Cnuibacter physcomitrellae TaxID=1619308 RepID=UPI0021760036|nr:hypothetical protein [Cnuibacter physcomitrellae]MCS5496237.1 hypothetical protein [Cnuibacter physcomitrellae]
MRTLDRWSLRLATWRWLPYATAAVLSLAALWIGFDLWHVDWTVPFWYSGDALAVASHFKTVIETGWFTYQPDLGAPYGQRYNDYPQADNLNFIAANLLRVFSGQFGVLMNVYFVLGFPLAALTAVWFLRRVGVSRTLSVALAVVYSLAPYHFIKGEGHLFLAQYFVVPLALGIVWRVATGRGLWRLRPTGSGPVRVLTLRNAATLGSFVLIATASSYYTVFVALLLAVAGVSRLWRTRRWRPFWGAAAAGGVLVVTMAINLLPDLLYRLQNGVNDAVLVRSPPEAELYSFKLAALLLPTPGHRFQPFATLRALYDAHYPLPSEQPVLGIIASAGLIALLVAALHLLLSSGRPGWRTTRSLVRRLSILAGLALTAFLFATVGGFSTFLSFVDFPIRSWNRMAILLALLSLAAVGLLLDRVVRRAVLRRRAATRRSSARRWVVAVPLAVVLVVLATWDQIPAVDQSVRAAAVASFDSDQRFAEDVEAAVPADCIVYQLPYIAFPESPPVNGMTDTDELRPFLHSDSVRWTAGGIKGRPEVDEVGSWSSLPVPELLQKLDGIDACGVVVDTAGYADRGADVLGQLQQTTGPSTETSDDGRFVFLSLALGPQQG